MELSRKEVSDAIDRTLAQKEFAENKMQHIAKIETPLGFAIVMSDRFRQAVLESIRDERNKKYGILRDEFLAPTLTK